MKKVLILFGGNCTEHYVSCKSCKGIIDNIDTKLFTYEVAGIDFDNNWYKFNDDLSYLENGNWKEANIYKIDNIVEYLKKFDVVFPITHGTYGEDGRLQGLLELFNIKFVGCKTLASAIGMDKEMSKIIFKDLGIPIVPYVVLNEKDKIKSILKEIEYPVIVKPANGGSSIGINKANNKKELEKAIKEARCCDRKIIIEDFIKARELEVAVLQKGNEIICSNPGEIKSANEFYDYNAKYENDDSYTKMATDLPVYIVNQIKEYAKKVFINLNCSGYARIDFFYDEKNEKILINEINTIPGFTPISMFPKLMKTENISYQDLITILINNA
ncbi:MAG: D-alanine--D-alanine ligase [Bacilli bacterium]|nr:D-alanine--D-alanine ligase [Bacilli bacterium]